MKKENKQRKNSNAVCSRRSKRSSRAKDAVTTGCNALHMDSNMPTREFGRDLANHSAEILASRGPKTEEGVPNMTEVQPYLVEIEAHTIQLDKHYFHKISSKFNGPHPFHLEITKEMRDILLKWLIQVGEKFKLKSETLHLCIQLVDHMLTFETSSLKKNTFQLLGITTLFIAAKYNEIYMPEAQRFASTCDGLYSIRDMIEMEGKVLLSTNFNLQLPIIGQFTSQILKGSRFMQNPDYCRYVKLVSNMLVFNFNLFNGFCKLTLAGVVLYFAAKLMNLDQLKSKNIIEKLGVDTQSFKNCYLMVIELYKEKRGAAN